jgi:hypothetical protein
MIPVWGSLKHIPALVPRSAGLFLFQKFESKLSFRPQKNPKCFKLGMVLQRGRDWLRLSSLRYGSNPRVLIPSNEKGLTNVRPFCREEGIRTLDTVTRILPFQGSSFNHSDTSLCWGYENNKILWSNGHFSAESTLHLSFDLCVR